MGIELRSSSLQRKPLSTMPSPQATFLLMSWNVSGQDRRPFPRCGISACMQAGDADLEIHRSVTSVMEGQDSESSSGFLTSPIRYQKWGSAIFLQWCGYRAPTSGHLHRCDCSFWEATEVLLTSSCLYPGVYYGGRLSGLCLHMVMHLLPPGYYLTAIFSLSPSLLGFIKPLHSLSPDLKAGLLRQWLLQSPTVLLHDYEHCSVYHGNNDKLNSDSNVPHWLFICPFF